MNREVLERYAEYYNKQEGRKFPCSNQIVTCGIITDDKDKALAVMNKKGAIMELQSYYGIDWKLNNEKWMWRNWGESSKGCRFYKVIVDENVNEHIFNCLVRACLPNYCCSFEII